MKDGWFAVVAFFMAFSAWLRVPLQNARSSYQAAFVYVRAAPFLLANAPMPDHIYLFRTAEEIRKMLTDCGFRIESESSRYAVDVPLQLAQKLKLPLMYAAFASVT